MQIRAASDPLVGIKNGFDVTQSRLANQSAGRVPVLLSLSRFDPRAGLVPLRQIFCSLLPWREGCLVEKKEAPSSGWGASEDGA